MIDCKIKEKSINCNIEEKIIEDETKERTISCKIKDVILYNIVSTYEYGFDILNYGFIEWRREEC